MCPPDGAYISFSPPVPPPPVAGVTEQLHIYLSTCRNESSSLSSSIEGLCVLLRRYAPHPTTHGARGVRMSRLSQCWLWVVGCWLLVCWKKGQSIYLR